jgi:formylglycine-generating enzyme required for sulfatase activity
VLATVAVPAGPSVAAFRAGRTPVTHAEYAAFVESGRAPAPPWWSDPAFAAADQPVVGVTWFEASDFAAWLSERTGERWRLPSEAEWEHAARGGLVGAATAWGDTLPEGEIPEGPLAGPWPAGRGTPNGYGLCDMGTIVHEWCLDWFDAAETRRASRGGSWRHHVRWSKPEARSSLPPEYRYADYGFRLLREL